MTAASGCRRSLPSVIPAAMVAAMTLGLTHEILGNDGESPLPRVRSEHQVIAAAIRDAAERSATFRRLVQTIDTTDGLVDVEEGQCTRSARACLLSVQVAGPYSLLHILVEPRKATSIELMSSIGHELQHAIEVLSNPKITDIQTLYQFYDRIARTDNNSFETPEATKAGPAVLDELSGRSRH